MTDVTLTPATPADLPAIAQLQIASWQDGYRGLLPDSYLDVEVPKALAAHWRSWPEGRWIILVAEEADALLGFVAVALDYAGGRGAYVDNLHVLPRAKGQGIGRQLMAKAARAVLEAGECRLWLTVLASNAPARAFYRALGGQEEAEWNETLFGLPVASHPVVWTDLAALASQPVKNPPKPA